VTPVSRSYTSVESLISIVPVGLGQIRWILGLADMNCKPDLGLTCDVGDVQASNYNEEGETMDTSFGSVTDFRGFSEMTPTS
jgi:hypothetical protein